MRVMLDTNILISAFVFKSNTINEVIKKLSEEHEIIIASYCIDELKEVVSKKFKVELNKIDKFLRKFPFDLVYSPDETEEKLFEIRDEYDYIILHTAIIENVDVLITGDKDFKEVEIEQPEILTAREFLDKYYKNK